MLRTARIVHKAGDRNVDSINLPEKKARFLKDIVNTLVTFNFENIFCMNKGKISPAD